MQENKNSIFQKINLIFVTQFTFLPFSDFPFLKIFSTNSLKGSIQQKTLFLHSLSSLITEKIFILLGDCFDKILKEVRETVVT